MTTSIGYQLSVINWQLFKVQRRSANSTVNFLYAINPAEILLG
ncbi:hypothetical protein [Oscillatoria sp. FACHB-1406]|nr:hypothetical protein [Oscillatoria sp. FACHB-1406]